MRCHEQRIFPPTADVAVDSDNPLPVSFDLVVRSRSLNDEVLRRAHRRRLLYRQLAEVQGFPLLYPRPLNKLIFLLPVELAGTSCLCPGLRALAYWSCFAQRC